MAQIFAPYPESKASDLDVWRWVGSFGGFSLLWSAATAAFVAPVKMRWRFSDACAEGLILLTRRAGGGYCVVFFTLSGVVQAVGSSTR